jgi:hypothetical protein
MPRSGTSWLSQILDSSPEVRFRLSPLFSYAFKNAVDESSSAAEWERLFGDVYASDDRFMDQTDRREAGHYPTFPVKSPEPGLLVLKMTRYHHLLRAALRCSPQLRMVAIVRHPCGAIHSWLTTPAEFPATADPLEEWRSGNCRKTAPEEFWGFEDWKRITRLHVQLESEFPERFRIVSYERLVQSAVQETADLFGFLDLEVGEQTRSFLHTSQTRRVAHSHAVFKDPSVRHRWRTELDPAIARKILAETEGADLARFLS